MVRARPAAVVAVRAGVVPEDWMDEQQCPFGRNRVWAGDWYTIYQYLLNSSTNQWEEDVKELTTPLEKYEFVSRWDDSSQDMG